MDILLFYFQHVEIMRCTTGEFVIIKFNKIVEEILATFNDATYKVKEDEGNSGGWSYAVSFFLPG